MRRFTVTLAVLLALPTLVAAQRGGSRSQATSRTDMFGDDPTTRRSTSITSNKLRDLDPIAILIDKHKDMGLTDDQVGKLKTMSGQLDEAQKPAFQVLDSLNQQISNVGSGGGNDDQGRLQSMNSFVRMVAGNIRQRYDSIETAALAVLTDDQKKKAADVLKDSHDQLSRLIGGRREN